MRIDGYEICNSLYDLEKKDDLYRLKIISTAYNCGTKYSLTQLEYISTLPAYPFGTAEPNSKWKYSELALEAYKTTSGL